MSERNVAMSVRRFTIITFRQSGFGSSAITNRGSIPQSSYVPEFAIPSYVAVWTPINCPLYCSNSHILITILDK